MKSFLILLFSFLYLGQVFPQEMTKIALIKKNNYELIAAENQSGIIYISLNELAEKLEIPITESDQGEKITIDLDEYSLSFNSTVPFVTILDRNNNSSKTQQLLNIPYLKNGQMFLSLGTAIELFDAYWSKSLTQLAPNRIRILDSNSDETNKSQQNKTALKILSITVNTGEDYSVFKIKTTGKVNTFYNFYRNNNLHLILWKVSVSNDSIIIPQPNEIVDKIEVNNDPEFTELNFSLNEKETITEILSSGDDELTVRISRREFGDWYSKESEHFKIIYRDAHSHLVNHILASAENSFKTLIKLFNYKPTEQIIINTYDVSDFGFGATRTIPQNYIRIEIEPLEPGYENIPYNERFQWLLSHELVHIVVNDMETNFESSLRKVMGKVTPDKTQPMTVPFSLLTNNNRFTPRWYQEAIAVFIETWLSGGYGRILGSYDEMYFRTMIAENEKFPTEAELEQITSNTSIFLESLFYIYGARFIAYIADEYGIEKLFNWFNLKATDFYPGYKGKFKEVFGLTLDDAWDKFIASEKSFQEKNINIIKKYPQTEIKRISENAFGWITQPFYDKNSNSLLFGFHQAGNLAEIQSFNLETSTSNFITTLKSPSMMQVASLAYDDDYKQIFYTTNNNLLYRDVWLYDLNDDRNVCIFRDSRVGQLTVSPVTHELWGIQHLSGKAILVRSKYPYTELQSLSVFDVGDEFNQLAINRNGDLLAATLHRSDGSQSIIVSDISQLENGSPFIFKTISSSGSPENPSWSFDGNFIYWNAYTNGVSNIYKYNFSNDEITPLSNTITGLFRPVEISTDTLLAMEFTLKGFAPVKFGNQKAVRLPAINYFGQRIIEKYPEVLKWNLKPASEVVDKNSFKPEETYFGLKNLSVKTFIPVVSGFQSRVVLGFFFQINDPLLVHDLTVETGISPFKETTKDIKFHLRAKYSLNQKFLVSAEYNAADFYDLFNKRKRGVLGAKYTVGYTNYWVYDNPLKIKQNTELAFHNGVKFINDNLTEVRQPDFAVLKSEIDIRDVRKTIGSIDWESGDMFRFTVLGYASDPNNLKYSGQIFGEWDNYSLFLIDHNVFHFKLTSGYHFKNDELPETQFFFGGFGNREVENEPVKQFEKMFRFPGVPIYSIISDQFIKIMIENSFPPLRIPDAAIGSLELKNINLSVYSQGLLTDTPGINKWIDIGAQLNIMFEHWSNLESTVSAGIAQAWWKNGNDTEWFISWKLLKD
ncbi:MAG: hypothetical protein WAV89_16315 [Ignavibacteriaceae bacterium]